MSACPICGTEHDTTACPNPNRYTTTAGGYLYTSAEVRERVRKAFVAGVDWWGVSYKKLKLKQARAEAARRYGQEKKV